MAGADTSLWPVVVGGLLTGLFALGRIGVGLVGTARRDVAQDGVRRRQALGIDSIPETASPFAKLEAISAVYSPQFHVPIREMDLAVGHYRRWIEDKASKRTSDSSANLSDGSLEAYRPYRHKFAALLDALTTFAHDEFQ